MKRFNVVRLGLILLVVWINAMLFPVQSKEYSFKHILSQSGKKIRNVRSISQDKQGYFWLAGDEGIARFDGHELVSISKHPTGRIFLSDNGDIWSSGTGTLLKYSVDSFESASYPYIDLVSQQEESNTVFHHYTNQQGGQFFASEKGIAELDTSLNKLVIHPIIIDDNKAKSMSHSNESATYLYSLENNRLFLGTNRGLFIISPSLLENNKTIHLEESIIASSRITNIIKTIGGQYFIGSTNGLYILNPQFKLLHHYPCLQQINCSDPKEITKMLEDYDGNVWIGTGTGLFIYQPENSQFISFKHSNTQTDSISNNFITDLHRDDLGNIFVATYSGVDYFNRQSLNIASNRLADGRPVEINNVWSIAEDSHQQLWLGTFGAGLYRVSQREVEHFSIDIEQPNSLQNNVIPSLLYDSNNRLWVGTNIGLQRYNYSTNKFISYPIIDPQTNVATREGILSIAEANKDTIWVGAKTFFAKIDIGSKRSKVYSRKTLPDFKVNQWVRAIQSLSNDRLLVGTDSGLHLFSPSNNKLTYFNKPAYVLKILRDSNRQLWILGTDGLYSFNEQKLQIKKWSNSTFEISNQKDAQAGCNNMVEDDYKQLWLVCRNGLEIFDLSRRQFIKRYSSHQDVDMSDFLTGESSLFKDSSGELIAGMRSGVFKWKASPQVSLNQKPRTAITRIFYGSRSNSDKSKNKQNFVNKNNRNISNELSYQLQGITFHFSTLGAPFTGSTRFQYRLLGYDDQWVNSEFKDLKASYTNLASGRYTFEVRAKFQGSEWAVDRYKFTVAQKPWFTWWAFSYYGLILFLLLIIIDKTRARRDAAQRKQLHRIIKDRTHELAVSKENIEALMREKEQFIENIYHQTKTPLQSMLSNINQLSNDELSAENFTQKQTEEIFKLSRLTEKALSVSQSGCLRQEQMKRINLSNLLMPLLLSYSDIAALKSVKFRWTIDQSVEVTCHPEQIETLIENLLSNAVKYTKKGAIKLTIQATSTHWFINCQDTGIGIASKDREKIFHRYTRAANSDCSDGSGIGLAMVKQILKQHSGSIRLSSELAEGSCFEIKLPMLQQEELESTSAITLIKLPTRVYRSNVDSTVPSSPENDSQSLILIVEDNLELATYLTKLLAHQYRTLTALSAEEALNKAVEWVPDLIISDVMMGRMDGYQLCRAIRQDKITNHIPLILVTAKSDPQSRINGYSVGANDFITKPFHQEMLLNRIKAQLQHVSNIRNATINAHQVSVSPVSDSLITRFLCLVEANYQNAELRIKDVCAELHISARQLERKVRYFIDMTPNEYLNEYRLLRSRELIQSGFLIKQVFADCGFSSQAYFAKKYKLKFCITPSQETTKTTFEI